MNTRLWCTLGLCLSVALGAGCDGDNPAPPQHDAGVQDDAGPAPRRLALFYTSDEHSHLFAFDPEVDDFPLPTTAGAGALRGGLARRAVLLTQERAAAQAAGVETLTVSAGDQTQGALPQVAYATSAPDFTLMKAMGYDIMCPGNHEFDRGPATYAAAITAAQAHGGLPPIVVSNIHFSASDAGDDTLAALYGEASSGKPITRYRVLTTPSGLKVGFFGIVGVGASRDAPLKVPVRFSGELDEEGDEAAVLPKIYADLTPTVQALRETEQVDVVVALSHSGVVPADAAAGEDYQIASHVAGIDLIISGHTHDALATPHLATGPDGHQVPIVQAGYFGSWLGRVELEVTPGARPTLVSDPTRTKLIAVTDAIVPSDTTMNDALVEVIRGLEADPAVSSQSFLEAALSRIEGTTISDDPAVVGDLYYRVMGQSTFDVPARAPFSETNGFNLAADAVLAAAEEVGGPTLAGITASGVVRADIATGATGDLTFADLFRVLPLGFNPATGEVGYPLVRTYLYLAEIKAAFEISARHLEGGFFPSPSGLHVYYDTSRPEQDLSSLDKALDAQNGRITKITADTNHADGLDSEDVVLFDLDRPAGSEWTSSMGFVLTLFPVTFDLYLAQFAGAFGLSLKDENGGEMTIEDAILTRADGSDVKEFEAFIEYVHNECAANSGLLPSRYNGATTEGTIPRRMICTGPTCP